MLRKSAGIGAGYCFPTAVCSDISCPTPARLRSCQTEGYAVPVFSPRRRFRYGPLEKAPRATRFRHCPPESGSGIVPLKKLRGLSGSGIVPSKAVSVLSPRKHPEAYTDPVLFLFPTPARFLSCPSDKYYSVPVDYSVPCWRHCSAHRSGMLGPLD